MAMIFMDGFDELPESDIDSFLGSSEYLFAAGCSQTVGRGARGKCLVMSTSDSLHRYIGGVGEVIVGHGWKYSGELTDGHIIAFHKDVGSADLEGGITVKTTISNGLSLTVGDTQVVLSQGNLFTSDVWCFMEHRIVLDSTTSIWQCRINNELVVDATFDGTGFAIDRIVFDNGTGVASGLVHYYDDLYVLDTTGSQNTSFIGDVFVENVPISGHSSPIQFSPIGSDQNWLTINETGTVDEQKFNASAEEGARDMFNVSDLSILSDEVFAVQVSVRAKKIGNGEATLSSLMVQGGVEVGSPDIYLDQDYRTTHLMFDASPDGNKWTIPAFNEMTIGYEISG